MGRKKLKLADDTDSSEDDANFESFEITDQDLNDEADGFNDRRKRRKFTKEDAMLGIFGDDDDDEPFESRDRRAGTRKYKDVKFVGATSTAKRVQQPYEGEGEEEEDMEENDGGGGADEPERRPKPSGDDDPNYFVDDYKSSDEESQDSDPPPRVPRLRVDEDEDDDSVPRGLGGLGGAPQRGGLGSGLGLALGSLIDTDIPRFPSQTLAAPFTSPTKPFSRISSPVPPSIASPARSDISLEDMASMRFGSTKGSRGGTRGARAGGGRADKVQQLRGQAMQQGLQPRSREGSPGVPPSLDKDFAKFTAHTKGFGMRMLERMGWQAGQGLGSDGSGIINPVETKQRPQKMGLAFNNFKERTQQSREEALRRGEVEEERENEVRATAKKEKRDAWRKDSGGAGAGAGGKTRKPRTTYKTADEIMQDASGSAPGLPAAAPQKIIDMTGPQARELRSASQIRSTPMVSQMDTTMRLPELRHNLRLLVDMAQLELENLTRERRIAEIRAREAERERERLAASCEDDERKMRRIEEVRAITKELEERLMEAQKGAMGEDEDVATLYGEWFDRLEREYMKEVEAYDLDALVVAAWAPVMKKVVATWEPLKRPGVGVEWVRKWRRLLRVGGWGQRGETDMEVDEEGLKLGRRKGKKSKKKDLTMTPYESMMYTLWLPKVRSTVNNEWNPRDYDPLITLLETWRPPLLPPFIHDNIVDQLILPKLTKEVTDWNPRHDPVMIHTWLHPWLPVLGADRLAPLFATVRQKLIVALRQWHPSDPSALRIIDPWRDVFSSADMETLIVKAVLPRLVAILRTEFTVNPRDQKTEPLQWVMAWRELLSPVHMGQLLEQEMFVKWASALYTWLVASPNFDDVAQWYSWWKSVLDGYGVVHANPIVQSCLRRGLDMMNQAAAGIKVNPPITPSASSSSLAASLSSPGRVSFAAAGSAVAGSAATMPRPTKSAQAIGPSVTFKDLLEEWAQSNNLLFLPTTKVHETSGRPLFRLGVGAGSVLVYVDNSDDLVFVREDAARWVPVDFDGMRSIRHMLRALSHRRGESTCISWRDGDIEPF